jgi:hypothetical protein
MGRADGRPRRLEATRPGIIAEAVEELAFYEANATLWPLW